MSRGDFDQLRGVTLIDDHMWDSWTKDGPKGYPCCKSRCCAQGARYNRTSHGWMEASCFTDWCEMQFLPQAQHLMGRKVLIGDNLASHFTDRVLRLCDENDVSFICLPPNSTHLCQPLDVAFFRPFKSAWRSTITKWKMKSHKSATVQKDVFPSLLNDALKTMDKNGTIGGSICFNLISGFSATGIFPFNPEKVLGKIPSTSAANPENPVSTALISFLQEKRFRAEPRTTRQRRTRRNVIPGKSVSARHSTSESSFQN